jgi:diguanylate cyclase (GGDEF)-like protein/PAS domain S-box-containing protein
MRHLAAIVEASDDAIIGHALDGTITSWNPAAERIYGYPAADALGRHISLVAGSEAQAAELASLLADVAAGAGARRWETTGRRGDGEPIELALTVSAISNGDREPVGAAIVARDISDQKRAERALRAYQSELVEQRELLSSVLDNAPIGMAIVSPAGRFLRVNRSLCEIVGYAEAELLALSFQEITHPDDLPAGSDYAERMLAGELRTYKAQKRYLHRAGHPIWVTLSVSLVRDGDGAPLHFISQIEDVTERHRHEAELERLATHDPLTGLPNRRLFSQRLDAEVASALRHGRPLAVALVDLDHFKQTNDTHGHLVGDRTLEEVSRRLEGVVRHGEMLARVGGEEFAWILPESDVDGALAAVERARDAVGARPFAPVGRLTISVGLAWLGEGEAPVELYRRADGSLYEAKRLGRNRVVCAAAAAAAPPLG